MKRKDYLLEKLSNEEKTISKSTYNRKCTKKIHKR